MIKAGVKRAKAAFSKAGLSSLRITVIGGSVLALCGLALAVSVGAQEAAPEAPQEALGPRPVVSEILATDAGQARAFPGLIVAKTETGLAFQTAGRIATREVSVGDRVAKGNALATLDQVTLEQDLSAARAALSAAQASAELAAQSLERAEELGRRGVAAPAQIEAALAERDASAAQALAATADLSRAEDAARFATLRAPMDGIVLSTAAEPGTVVAAGTVVLTLASEIGREAVIDVPADLVAALPAQAGFTIQRRGDAFDRAPISGVLLLIEPVADASTRTRRLRVTLAPEAEQGGDLEADLRIGTLVTATLNMEAHPVLTLPLGAIIGPDAGSGPEVGARVWRVTPERHAQAVNVTLGAQIASPSGARVVITSGLAAGDEILTRGVNSLREGDALGRRIEGAALGKRIE